MKFVYTTLPRMRRVMRDRFRAETGLRCFRAARWLLANCNDMRLELDELRDPDGAYINTATVTATLLDSDGEEVEGVTWPVTLEYVEESDGKYQGILDDAIELVDKEIYTLVVDSVDGESKGHWELAVQARTRTKWA